jgi:hypothetical protein
MMTVKTHDYTKHTRLTHYVNGKYHRFHDEDFGTFSQHTVYACINNMDRARSFIKALHTYKAPIIFHLIQHKSTYLVKALCEDIMSNTYFDVDNMDVIHKYKNIAHGHSLRSKLWSYITSGETPQMIHLFINYMITKRQIRSLLIDKKILTYNASRCPDNVKGHILSYLNPSH